MNNIKEYENVTRVEVIDHGLPLAGGSARVYTNYSAEDVSFSLQDGGKTIKIFLKSTNKR